MYNQFKSVYYLGILLACQLWVGLLCSYISYGVSLFSNIFTALSGLSCVDVLLSLLKSAGRCYVDLAVSVVSLTQEWEAFTGLIVSDTKNESDKDIPNWIEPDRTPAIVLLKVTKRFFHICSLSLCTGV